LFVAKRAAATDEDWLRVALGICKHFCFFLALASDLAEDATGFVKYASQSTVSAGWSKNEVVRTWWRAIGSYR
jgi:hypothetical protein